MKKNLLIPILLVLSSCTNAIPEIGKMFEISGPKIDVSNFTVDNNSEILNLKGECLSGFDSFLVKVNDSSWSDVSSIVDSGYSNDYDCYDKIFNFYINVSQFNLSVTNSLTKIYFKQTLKQESTGSSEIKVSYLNQRKALLTNTSFSKSSLTANFQVGGNNISSFKYKFGNSVNCSDYASYSSSQAVGALNLNLTGLTDGQVTICLLGGNATGYQEISTPTTFTWELDSTPPPEPTLTNSPLNYDNKSSYSVTINSLSATKYRIKLREINDCATDTNYSEYDLNLPYSFSISSISSLANETLYLCVYSLDEVGNKSTIKTFSWIQDMTAPIVPVASLVSNLSSSTTSSPTINISSTTDTGSPMNNYLFKIKKSDNSILLDWTSYSLNPSIVINSLSLVEDTYSLYAKVVDIAGNESSELFVGTWRVDTTAPSFSSQTISIPYNLNSSALFKVTYSDLSPISTARAWLLDSTHSIVSGPINITSGVNFSFSVGVSKNSTYYLKVEVVDSVGNGSNREDLSYQTANCVNSNPNSATVVAGICDDVNLSSIIGWEMQGGWVIGVDALDSTKILVFSKNVSSAKQWSSANETSGIYYSSGSVDTGSTYNRPGLTGYSQAYTFCNSLVENSVSGWFLPTINQITRLMCNSNQSGNASPGVNPESDPGCSLGSSTTFPLTTPIELWSVTESSSTEAYSINDSLMVNNSLKLSSLKVICFRKFSK